MYNDQPILPGSVVLPKAVTPTSPQSNAMPSSTIAQQAGQFTLAQPAPAPAPAPTPAPAPAPTQSYVLQPNTTYAPLPTAIAPQPLATPAPISAQNNPQVPTATAAAAMGAQMPAMNPVIQPVQTPSAVPQIQPVPGPMVTQVPTQMIASQPVLSPAPTSITTASPTSMPQPTTNQSPKTPASPPQPQAADQNLGKKNKLFVFGALAVSILAIFAQVFASGTPGFALILCLLAAVGVYMGVVLFKAGQKKIAVAAIVLGSLAFIGGLGQAGLAIYTSNRCLNDPVYNSKNAACQR